MHARTLFAATLLISTSAAAETHVRAALSATGDAVRLIVDDGKKASANVTIGKGKPIKLYDGEAVGAIEAGHGRVVVALSIDDAKKPFRIATFEGGKLVHPLSLARPGKAENFPFAVALTPTPDGFAVFFQEVETNNPNEAHTYLVELDKDGALASEAKEVQIPWALAAVAWNGNGYHLALFYTGGGNGIVLSMVSTDAAAIPQGHPDWSSAPTAISDVHLVASGKRVRAFYRGAGRLVETDVTTIGQWGQNARKAVDRGALGKETAIAISAKGEATKVAQK